MGRRRLAFSAKGMQENNLFHSQTSQFKYKFNSEGCHLCPESLQRVFLLNREHKDNIQCNTIIQQTLCRNHAEN